MADDLDPAAVLARMESSVRDHRAALAAARDGETAECVPVFPTDDVTDDENACATHARTWPCQPIAPTVTAEQVRAVQYAHIGDDGEPLGMCVLVGDLPALGIEVREP